MGANNIEEFLFNDTVSNYLYIDKEYSYNSNYYYKEKYNDRFYLIYERRYSSNDMTNNDYEFAGYYDAIDKVLYNPGYDINNLLVNSTNVKVKDLVEISNQIEKDVIAFIKQYCQNNSAKLKKENKENYDKQEEYIFNSYTSYIDHEFVKSEIDSYVPLPDYSGRFFYEQEFTFSDNKIYTEYLNNPVETIIKIGNYLINNKEVQKDLGIMLLKNDFQNDYLKEIIINKNGKFDNLYLNKKLLNCLKNVEAVNINITIEYNNQTLTFKYPKNTIVSDLLNCDKDTDSYGKSYEIVEDFLDKYKNSDEPWHKHKFDFQNIKSITYGKNTLYEKDKSNEKEIDIEEEMDK